MNLSRLYRVTGLSRCAHCGGVRVRLKHVGEPGAPGDPDDFKEVDENAPPLERFQAIELDPGNPGLAVAQIVSKIERSVRAKFGEELSIIDMDLTPEEWDRMPMKLDQPVRLTFELSAP